MRAVVICEKFLTRAQGTPDELEVLKSQVKLILARSQVCCLESHALNC